MKKLSKKTIFTTILLLITISLFFFFFKKQETPEEPKEDISHEIVTDAKKDIVVEEERVSRYQEYIDWAKETNNEFLLGVLEETIDDVFDTYDWSNLEKITPKTELPEIDLSESQNLFFEINEKNKLQIKYEKPEGYDDPGMYIYMWAKVFFNGEEIDGIVIREEQDTYRGSMSLHIYDHSKLKYPVVIVGNENIFSSRDVKVIYFLINDELVKYNAKYGENINEIVNSTIAVDIYVEDNTPYLFTYWEDPALGGLQITKWKIHHDIKQIERIYSVLSIERK